MSRPQERTFVRRHLFELLALVLIIASLFFFYSTLGVLGRHDYMAAALLGGIGFVLVHVGAEMARLALADRSS